MANTFRCKYYLQNDNSTGMPQQHVTCFDQILSEFECELFKTIISGNVSYIPSKVQNRIVDNNIRFRRFELIICFEVSK